MTLFDSNPKSALESGQLCLGHLTFDDGGLIPIHKMIVYLLSEAGGSGIFLGDAHGIAVELVCEIGSQRGSFWYSQQARAEMINDSRCVLSFLDLKKSQKTRISTHSHNKNNNWPNRGSVGLTLHFPWRRSDLSFFPFFFRAKKFTSVSFASFRFSCLLAEIDFEEACD